MRVLMVATWAVLSVGCHRAPLDRAGDAGISDDAAPCTDPSCLWDCSESPDRCELPLPTPGGGGWACAWTEFKYTCRRDGSKDSPPSAGGRWTCAFDASELDWVCILDPVPAPGDVMLWTCMVDEANEMLVCVMARGGPHPDPGAWTCMADGETCEQLDDNGGLPVGGGGWKCHQVMKNSAVVWICYGEAPAGGTPPGGGGWSCAKVKSELGLDIYRCERPEGPGDYPPGGGYWSCVKGSAFGGTICTRVAGASPPPPYPGTCAAGERKWCDGLTYSGWGQIACDPATGKWKTTVINGKTMEDCSETLAGGKVPDTVCACYHLFFNPSCCEQASCVVPPGTSGQLCEKSQGQLCDHCNPLAPECVEPGARCIVTNSHENFCGRDCTSATCPGGYDCMTVKLKVGTTRQCVPSDMSCYY
jgi:hypothetical protein